jgi:pilus assembly protein Flp/PilA
VSGLDFVESAARFLKSECGATAIEYAIIAGTLSIAIVTTVSSLGTSVNSMFTSVQAGLK